MEVRTRLQGMLDLRVGHLQVVCWLVCPQRTWISTTLPEEWRHRCKFWTSLNQLLCQRRVCPAGGKLAAGKRVVTEDDFIVGDSEEEYETASSTGGEEDGSDGSSPSPGVEDDWVDWADGEDVDDKLRSVVNGKGVTL